MEHEHRLLPLSKGQSTVVDAADYEAVIAVGGWHARRSRPDAPWYAVHSIHGQRPVALHTWLTGWVRVDHIDRDGLNNCRDNLRETTNSLNSANRRGWSKHGYKGVFRQTNGRWAARVGVRGATYLGTFDTIEEAAADYDVAAAEIYGEHALLNFPQVNGPSATSLEHDPRCAPGTGAGRSRSG